MKGIFGATRSGFRTDEKLYGTREPAEILCYSFMNTLSMSAIDERSISRVVIFTNLSKDEENSLIRKMARYMGVGQEIIEVAYTERLSESELTEKLKALLGVEGNVLIGALSFNKHRTEHDWEVNSIKSTDNQIGSLLEESEVGKLYRSSSYYQAEIFPLQFYSGKVQEGNLFDKLDGGSEQSLKSVEGVASMLFAEQHSFNEDLEQQIAKLDHWYFENDQEENLHELLKTLQVDDNWVVELDYLTMTDYQRFNHFLAEHGILLPEVKSGGSFAHGNATVLNGFRAITSAFAQLGDPTKEKALVLILDGAGGTRVFKLEKNREVSRSV